eukprot:1160113-Pelagomonas_calceolata.AAC.5
MKRTIGPSFFCAEALCCLGSERPACATARLMGTRTHKEGIGLTEGLRTIASQQRRQCSKHWRPSRQDKRDSAAGLEDSCIKIKETMQRAWQAHAHCTAEGEGFNGAVTCMSSCAHAA